MLAVCRTHRRAYARILSILKKQIEMSKGTSSVDLTNDDNQDQDKKQNENRNAKSGKQRKLDAINESMRLNEDNLSLSKAKVLRLQNRVSSLENIILTGIQEKTKILAEDKNDDDGDKKESPDWRALQGEIKTLKESLKTNEEELATSKAELSSLQDRVTSLEYKIIAEIQEKARINLIEDDNDNNNKSTNDDHDAQAKKSSDSPAKRQKVT